MSSENLRRILLSTAISKKSDKLQQKIQNQITTSIKDWEIILYDYINLTSELKSLTQMAEQQKRIVNIRQTLNECTELVKVGNEQFEKIWKLVEFVVPISVINNSWMDNIIKYDQHLGQMKEALAPLLLFSCNREVIEVAQKMMLHITDIQSKINILTEKVREAIEDTFKYGSTRLENGNMIHENPDLPFDE